MRIFPLLLLLACVPPASGQGSQEKRVSGLEKRMTSVEKRVSRLEKGAAASPAAASPSAPAEPANPIAAVFVAKKQVVGKQLGVKLLVELENTGRKRYFAFNGVLVFRDENGTLIWSKPYAYGEPLLPGEKIEVTLGVSSDQTKEYLRFVKARDIKVALEKQEAYSSD